MPYVRFIAICLMWGASFILMKKAGLAFGPISIAAIRVLSGGIVLGSILALLVRGGRIGRAHWGSLVGVAAVGYVWPYAVQPYLVRLHGSGFIGMSIALVPLLTLAVAPLMLGVYPSRRQMIGVVGGLICMLGIFRDGLDRQVPIADLALAATVPLCYALTNTYIRKRFVGVHSLTLSAATLGLSAAMLIPLAFACEDVPRDTGASAQYAKESSAQAARLDKHSAAEANASRPILVKALSAALLLGIFGTGLATYLFNKLVQEQGPLFAGMTTYLVPIGAMLWGFADGERVTTLQLVSLSGILGMVALVQYGAAAPPSANGPQRP